MSKQKRRKLEKPLADLQAEGEYEDEISSTNPNSPISDQWQEQGELCVSCTYSALQIYYS